eukprot:scaffold638196_cov51-Prasinocladus_malaysianus.AAC.1
MMNDYIFGPKKTLNHHRYNGCWDIAMRMPSADSNVLQCSNLFLLDIWPLCFAVPFIGWPQCLNLQLRCALICIKVSHGKDWCYDHLIVLSCVLSAIVRHPII